MKKIVCLGIESTAHTFGIGIVNEKCKILANEKSSFATEQEGIVPREAANHHIKNAREVIHRAMQKAGLEWEDIGLIAFSQGPGLGPCLAIGATVARTLALLHKKPLLGVNHCIAHIEIGKKLTGAKDPLIVYASGANTQIIGYESKRYRIFGETLDIGIGNVLDSFGRKLGIGFPAGPKLDEMYFKGNNFVELPYTVKGMDLVFSGLLTAAEQKINGCANEDLAYSLLHTAFAMLTEVTERAAVHAKKSEILLTGGVAASKALQKMTDDMCREHEKRLFVTPKEFAVDNGTMIAWQGVIEFLHGKIMRLDETKVKQNFRADQVVVGWV